MNYAEKVTRIKALRAEINAKETELNALAEEVVSIFIEDTQKLIEKKFGVKTKYKVGLDFESGCKEHIIQVEEEVNGTDAVLRSFLDFRKEKVDEFSTICETHSYLKIYNWV